MMRRWLTCLILLAMGCGDSQSIAPALRASNSDVSQTPQWQAEDLHDWSSQTDPQFNLMVLSETSAYLAQRLTQLRETKSANPAWQLSEHDDLRLLTELDVHWKLDAEIDAEPDASGNFTQPQVAAKLQYQLGDEGVLELEFDPGPPSCNFSPERLKGLEPGDKVEVSAKIQSVNVGWKADGTGVVAIVLSQPVARLPN